MGARDRTPGGSRSFGHCFQFRESSKVIKEEETKFERLGGRQKEKVKFSEYTTLTRMDLLCLIREGRVQGIGINVDVQGKRYIPLNPRSRIPVSVETSR